MTVFFADLDGTTIYSRRRLENATDVVVVEYRHGQPAAWMTADASRRLATISRRLDFVPTTTRVLTQYGRVDLPGVRHRYAIVANGACILDNGAEDANWAATIRERTANVEPLERVRETFAHELRNQEWVRRVSADQWILSVNTHRAGPTPPDAFYVFAADAATEFGYRFYRQGPKTFLIPNAVTKEAAAAEIAARLGNPTVFAAGDHRIDAGLLRFADHGIRPAHGAHVTGIPATERTGVHAGEDILSFVEERLPA